MWLETGIYRTEKKQFRKIFLSNNSNKKFFTAMLQNKAMFAISEIDIQYFTNPGGNLFRPSENLNAELKLK